MKQERLRIFASPGWTLFLDDGKLFASAGADEMYLLDTLDRSESERLLDGYRAGTLDELEAAAPSYAQTIGRLIQAGAVFRGSPTPLATLNLSALQCGELVTDWHSCMLAQEVSDTWTWTEEPKVSDLCLVFRAGATLASVAEATRDLGVPHLLVDISNQHTLSLGPLVKPGQTACLSCLAGKISRHWGDPPVPTEPQMSRQTQLVAALVVQQVRRFRQYGTCPELIERLWSFDLNSLECRFDCLLQLPWCPRCFPDSTVADPGSIPLPWA